MPLEEIRNLLDGAIDLPTALAQQKDRLKAEQERIQGAILFCEWIQERKLEELDVDNCLQKMEAEEKRGSLFANILYDYKRVIKGESIRVCSGLLELSICLFMRKRNFKSSFVFLTKNLAFSSFSSDEMCALMVGCVRNSCFAAFEKLPPSAT